MTNIYMHSFILQVQEALPEASVSWTHDNRNIKIEDGIVFGILRVKDNQFYINDGGSLMALASNDSAFVPAVIFEHADEVANNLPEGIIFTPTEFMMPLKTINFRIEELSEYWGKYKLAYNLIISLTCENQR